MTQHITQEQAVELAHDIPRGNLNYRHTVLNDDEVLALCNAAIQWDREQRAKELPELPEVTTFDQDIDGTMEPVEDGAWVRSEVFYNQLKADRLHVAAHAREKALSEVKDLCTGRKANDRWFCETRWDLDKAIDALKVGK